MNYALDSDIESQINDLSRGYMMHKQTVFLCEYVNKCACHTFCVLSSLFCLSINPSIMRIAYDVCEVEFVLHDFLYMCIF